MPVTRPSDKSKDSAQWWKDEPEQPGEIPEGPTANNKDGAGKNNYDEEMHPTRRPT
jgi:hypothetical protein